MDWHEVKDFRKCQLCNGGVNDVVHMNEFYRYNIAWRRHDDGWASKNDRFLHGYDFIACKFCVLTIIGRYYPYKSARDETSIGDRFPIMELMRHQSLPLPQLKK